MSGKIDHQLFSAQALTQEPCPKCGAALQLRHGKHGPFLGCSQYPGCDFIKPLHQNDGHIIKELGVPCQHVGMSWCCVRDVTACLLAAVITQRVTTSNHLIQRLRRRPRKRKSPVRIVVKAIWLNAKTALGKCSMPVMRFPNASLHSINHPWWGNVRRAVIRY